MKKQFSPLFLILTASVITFFSFGCAYRLSAQTDSLPGNVKLVQIPMFKNDSSEVGAETFFTNSLKTEAIRAKFVDIKNEQNQAQAVLQGRITQIDVIADESVTEAQNTQFLPTQTVLATQYRVTVNVNLVLTENHTNKVLWSGEFKQTKSYSAPQITLPGINTANSLYNESAKRQTLSALAKEMMQ
ncbi:MAG: LPS assembly lipoprotein LptE, partial [Pseudobdellovibrio sp.]